jgi:ketosteroid isomerase-like protein
MSTEENKALVRRFLEAHASGDVDIVDEMLASDFVDHNLIPGQRPPDMSSRSSLQKATRW